MSSDWGTLLIAVFGGGALMRFLEYIAGKLFDRLREDDDAELQFRDELRDTIAALKRDVKDLQDEARSWREKYYEQQQANVQLRSDFEVTKRELHQTQQTLRDVEAQLHIYKDIVQSKKPSK